MTNRLQPLPGGKGFTAASAFGPIDVLPSHRHWRRRHAYWRAVLTWSPRTRLPYRLTAELALAAALWKLSPGAVAAPDGVAG